MNEKQLAENELYWKQRAEQRLISAEQKVLRLEKDLGKQFDQVYKDIEEKIAKLYFKYADENGLSYDEAVKYLSQNERKEFQKNLKYYIEKSKDAEYSQRFNSHLKALSTRVRIQRLEELKLNIKYEVNELYDQYRLNTQMTFDDIFKSGYYKTIFDIQQFQGFGVAFNRISSNILESILEYPWSGKNYSEKIWANVDNFSNKLEDVLTAGIIQGKSNQDMAAELQKATDTAYKNAIRLVRTETNFIAGEATHKAYQAYGVEKYQYLATLDLRTSDICRSLDGKVFEERDRKPGVNCHPMHPHCRSTDIPYIPDMEGTRVARGSDGKTYKIDRNTTYDEWYKKHVEGNAHELRAEKMIKNKSKDQKQYEKYKNMLGGQVPKSFESFQELKYNNSDSWTDLKKTYGSRSRELRKQNKGLSSGGASGNKSIPIYVEKIDFNDKSLVSKKIQEYESKIVNSPTEHAYAIEKDGNVYRFEGNEYSVNPLALEEKLKGSIVTHNHPEAETHYSFSDMDIDLFINNGLQELRGVDYKYRYIIKRLKDTKDESSDVIINKFKQEYYYNALQEAFEDGYDMDDAGYHLIVEQFAKDYNFAYERIKLHE